MIEIHHTPHGTFLDLRHETDGAIAPDGSLVPPVVTQCRLEIPPNSAESAELIVDIIRRELDWGGLLYDEEDDEEG